MRKKFKQYEAIVYDPDWWDSFYTLHESLIDSSPLKRREVVYYLGEIPNVPEHCLVARYSGQVVAMVHFTDFRKAKDEEL